jgi:hypothetical protein
MGVSSLIPSSARRSLSEVIMDRSEVVYLFGISTGIEKRDLRLSSTSFDQEVSFQPPPLSRRCCQSQSGGELVDTSVAVLLYGCSGIGLYQPRCNLLSIISSSPHSSTIEIYVRYRYIDTIEG